jgi:hypothetical protein
MGMTRDEFVNSIETIYSKCVGILKKKNQDYAGQDNPFKNFEFSQLAGIDIPHAIMVRILDKMARIGNLLNRPAVVVDEKIEDTIEDCINYLAILETYLVSRSNANEKMIK